MSNDKKYKLLKEISDPRWSYPKGSVFTKTGVGYHGAYTCGNFALHPETVRNNPDWFEEVVEQPKQRAKVSIDDYNGRVYQAIITATGIISKSKYLAIKEAIEGVLNDDKVGEDVPNWISKINQSLMDENALLHLKLQQMQSKNFGMFAQPLSYSPEQKPVYWNEHAKNVYQTKPSPLFTTEDGVEVFNGDTCYWVNTIYESYWSVNKDDVESIFGYGWQNEAHMKIFSTEEKAKKHVLMNKPCLSVNEVWERVGVYLFDTRKEQLIGFAKQKINTI